MPGIKKPKKGAEAPFLFGFYSSLVLFFLRLKATPNPAAVIEPRIVRGSGKGFTVVSSSFLSSSSLYLNIKYAVYKSPCELVGQ